MCSSKGGIKVKDRELATFCKELAIIVRAGMTLEETFEFIEQDNEDDDIKQIIRKIKKALKVGRSMDKALQETGEFPEYMLYMIQIGVMSHRLGDILEALTQNYLREARLKASLRRAVNYPIYLGGIMCSVMILLVVKVMPIFDEIFSSWTGELTQGAKFFLRLGKWMEGSTVGVFISMLILSILGVLCIKTQKGRKVSRHILGYTNISARIDIAHFSWVMGIMLKAGFKLDQSLQKSLLVVRNKSVRQRVKYCMQMIGEKETFEDALIESKIFSRAITRIIVSSYNNGQLQDVMKQVGEESERIVQYALENRVLAIETILVGITSIIIGSILITVMLSLMGVLIALGI